MDLKKELCDFKRHKTGADTVLLQKNEVSSYEEVAFAKTEDLYRILVPVPVVYRAKRRSFGF
jgi:hypothetical protein